MTNRRATVPQCVVLLHNLSALLQPCRDLSLLQWQMREFCRFGVTEFLLCGHGAETAAAQAQDLPRPARIIAVEAPPHTWRAACGDLLHERFLLWSGHLGCDANLAPLLQVAACGDGTLRAALRADTGPDHVDSGIWLLQRDLSGVTPRERAKLKREPLSQIEAEALAGSGLPNISRGTSTGWDAAVRTVIVSGHAVTPASILACKARKALFLDRDGVLNVDHGYVGSQERFEWIEGALDAVRFATESGWHVFIVTNQSGVARGLYNENAVSALLEWIADCARATGGTIDDARYCPFHPDAVLAAYRQAHPWRKPQPGMLLDLIARWSLDPRRAVMVGDQATDLQAASAAGVSGHLFTGGNLLAFLRPILLALP